MIRPELVTVLIAVTDDRPMVLTLGDEPRLPAGALDSSQRSLQAGTRLWAERLTGLRLGHIEQLYTFADAPQGEDRTILISYLALAHMDTHAPGWRDWYGFFPWEDQISPKGRLIADGLLQRLRDWAARGPAAYRAEREERLAATFARATWDDELVLQRYELLWEAGLVPEAPHAAAALNTPGSAMLGDHRRILATAMARLRARIRYRPVIFELMPEAFTLLALQKTIEAVAGVGMHKQNFRRLVAQQDLVEDTGCLCAEGPGRPARLYRFRREIIGARRIAGSRLPLMRP